jgi:peroxiredoxin
MSPRKTITAGLSGAAELPLPAIFVISPTGKIRLAYINEDYAKRLSPDDILTALRSSAAA